MGFQPTRRPVRAEDTFDAIESQLAAEAGVPNFSTLTYAQLDSHIDTNVTNLVEARTFLKKLSRVLLFVIRNEYL